MRHYNLQFNVSMSIISLYLLYVCLTTSVCLYRVSHIVSGRCVYVCTSMFLNTWQLSRVSGWQLKIFVLYECGWHLCTCCLVFLHWHISTYRHTQTCSPSLSLTVARSFTHVHLFPTASFILPFMLVFVIHGLSAWTCRAMRHGEREDEMEWEVRW